MEREGGPYTKPPGQAYTKNSSLTLEGMLFPINITFFFLRHIKRVIFSLLFSHRVQVPSSLPAPESSLLSYFWLILLIQPEFPHSLSSGCQQIPTPVPPYSCLTSPCPEASEPVLSRSSRHVPLLHGVEREEQKN